MDDVLIAVNALLLAAIWFSARNTLLGRPLLVLITVMSLYFVLLPSFNDETLYAWRFATLPVDDLRHQYLQASTVFLLFFWATLATGLRISLPVIDRGWSYLFSGLETRGLVAAFIVFVGLCYSAQVILHGSPFYILESKSAFEVATENNSGRWSLVILGSSLIYPMVMLLGHLHAERRLMSVILYTVILSLIYLAICTPQTRSWAASLLLSFMFLRTERVGLLRFGISCLLAILLSLLLLFILDRIRQGQSFDDLEFSTFLINLPQALALLFTPYENSLLAIDHADATSNFYWFRYLLGALTPLQLLPSSLFPFRPDVDKERVMTESILGEIKDFDYFQDDSTFTFTILGSGYADAGTLGVAVSAILYGFITVVLSRGLQFSGSARLTAYYILILFFAGYRLSVEVNLQGLYTILMFVLLVRFLSRSKSSKIIATKALI